MVGYRLNSYQSFGQIFGVKNMFLFLRLSMIFSQKISQMRLNSMPEILNNQISSTMYFLCPIYLVTFPSRLPSTQENFKIEIMRAYDNFWGKCNFSGQWSVTQVLTPEMRPILRLWLKLWDGGSIF